MGILELIFDLSLTDRCILGLRVLFKVLGIKAGDLPLLLWLILIDFQGLLVENVFRDVCLNFVVGSKCKEMSKGLLESRKVVVDFEFSSNLRQLLELSKEGEIFSGVLFRVIRYDSVLSSI